MTVSRVSFTRESIRGEALLVYVGLYRKFEIVVKHVEGTW